jgi:hypothetical protein
MNDHLAETKFREDLANQALRRTAPRVVPFARFLLAGVLILSLSLVAEAGLFQKDPDFSNYDVPRTKSKIFVS